MRNPRTIRGLWLVMTLIAGLLSGLAMAEEETYTPSMALGKNTFRIYCASCHGREAVGDGPLSEHLRVAPADLTRIAERHDGVFPEERVFKIIDGREPVRGHGSSDMPIWGEVFQNTSDDNSEEKVEQRILDLVHFLKSIQKE